MVLLAKKSSPARFRPDEFRPIHDSRAVGALKFATPSAIQSKLIPDPVSLDSRDLSQTRPTATRFSEQWFILGFEIAGDT
jgi:hypothetical protein